MNDLFLLDCAVVYGKEGMYAEITEPVCLPSGKPITIRKPDEPFFKRWHLASEIDVRDVEYVTLRVHPYAKIADFLSYAFKGTIIFSRNVVDALDNAAIRIDDHIIRVPFNLLNDHTGKILDEYVLMWPLKYWDCLDYEKSDFEYYEGIKNKIIRCVNEWHLDPDLTPDLDLFPTDYRKQWFVSSQFKQVINKQGFSGFKFTCI